jgi:hypothetical protein
MSAPDTRNCGWNTSPKGILWGTLFSGSLWLMIFFLTHWLVQLAETRS